MGADNLTRLLDIPEIGDGDTIRIWGVEDYTYEGGITIAVPNVTVERWEGSPAQPLISGTVRAFTVRADNATFRGLNISGNTLSFDGGAGIDAYGIQGLTIAECTFAGNTGGSGLGGALHAQRVDHLLVERTAFAGNTAESGGGAYFDSSTDVALTDTTFTNNTATQNGGGAYFVDSTDVALTGTTFTNNTAVYGGGGVFFFNSAGVVLAGAAFTHNTATNDGGGAYFGSTGAALTDTTFTHNTATNCGGGAYFTRSAGAALTRTTFANNMAENSNGGGAYFEASADARLTGTIFTNNTANSDGGGAYFDSICSRARLTDATFANNTATNGGGAFFSWPLGATPTDIALTDITFTNNDATQNGGGAYFGSTGTTLTNTTFTNNMAAQNGGGAFFRGSTGAALTDTTFANNMAARNGGGACFDSSANATLTGATFTNNMANSGGGVFFVRSEGARLMTDTTVANNTADFGGGACFDSSANAALTGATFTNNTAMNRDGGGVFFISSTGAVITNCRFENPTNIYAVGSAAVLNATRTLGTNIAGGPYLGGNLWLNDPAQNISEWSADADFDGICDQTLDIPNLGTDSLPLMYGRGTVAVNATPTGGFIFVDGTNTTRTANNAFYLPAGNHTLEVVGATAYGRATVGVTAGTIEIMTIVVLKLPAADLTFTPSEGNAPLAMTFTDASTGDVTAWLWDFGDGTTSTAQNPNHVYASAGTYTVSLNASNAYRFNVSTVTDAVRVFPALVAGFTFTPPEGNAPLTVTFTDASTGNVTAWLWDFGDGTTSTERSPTHTYTNIGTYTVSLNASNAYGFNVSTVSNAVVALAPPVAGFTLTPSEGNAPLTVTFTDASTGDVTAWLWDFDDGTTSTEQNPNHVYTGAGTYTVSLNASNAYGFNVSTVTDAVRVLPPPVADFTFTPAEGNAPLTVTFTDTSRGDVTALLWDFGDGNVSFEQNPNHIYASAGTYTVSLNASNAYGFNVSDSTVHILPPPTANFTQSAEEGNAPLTIEFTDASTGNVTALLWDFGDGNVSSEQNPSHEYVAPGTYTVQLNASNAYGFSLSDSTVKILPPPAANFTQSADEGNAPLEVIFTDASTGNVTSWRWDFGDGNVSSEQNPSHEYVTPGTYTAQLNASNAYGFSLSDSTVRILPPPLANFTQSTGEGNAPLTVAFTDGSTGNVTSWQWDFGDGNVSTEPSPSHEYVTPGTYTVRLNASNAYGFCLSDSTVRILPPPLANFTQSTGEGNAPLTVAFTDVSTGNVTAWVWDFGDGNVSSAQNPLHEYVTPGTYTVRLNASNAYGFSLSDSMVRILTPPTANFTQSAEEGNAPLAVVFTDVSTGNVTSWRWDFGDGGVSSEQNPSHEYVTSGTYTVRLNASNAYGFSLSDSTVCILPPPRANFTQSAEEGNAPLTVAFTDVSTGNVTAWAWDFGDGNVSSVQNPSHEYVTAGTYTVRLNASNAYGFNLFDSTVRILTPPTANFTQNIDEGNAPLAVVFTDASTGNVTAWAWDFGDGNVSSAQNPTHTYTRAGTYTVLLNASNAYRFNVSTVTDAVRVFPAPVAGFTVTPNEGNVPLTVTFTDASTGNVTALLWDFGDGTTSNEQNPIHIYASAGTYTVRLTVGNGYGNDTSTANIAVKTPASHGSGGSHSAASAGTASNIPAGGHASFGIRNSAISEVGVTAGEHIPEVLVTVERQGLPSGVDAPAGTVYEYDEVTLYRTTDAALAGASLNFTVPKAWLEAKGSAPESVVLYRYHDGEWQALPTGIVGEDAYGYSLSATSPGFSLFAIGATESGPAPTPTATVTALPVTTPAATATTTQQSPVPLGLAVLAAGVALLLRGRLG